VKKTPLSIAAAAVISIAGGTAGFAAELPTYESAGFPVSAVQVQVLGAANVQEQSPVPTSTASPHQLRVRANLHGLSASAESPNTANENDDRDGRSNPDRNRSLNSLSDTSIAV
jgi:hypothetical protein